MSSEKEIEQESYEAITGSPEETEKGMQSGAAGKRVEKPQAERV